MENQESSPTVLPQKFGAGPYGLGDPDDKSLRRVEKEVMVPKVMRDKAKVEKCLEEVQAFESCCKQNSLLMVVTCRKQNNLMKECLAKWYQDEVFKKECTEVYLKERSEFRRTGLEKKHREYIAKQHEAGIA
ncbi:CLUMA_CG007752, isoform A [Clunio marinus]|uniref:COX assembly mitochondrial protein n=1 Tax=Clunio marinus TaxID=568069 RepID=A0A1J1I1S4_9DIPT|nr:CLUMA_CG007752, isoform A [Clunio marinus]